MKRIAYAGVSSQYGYACSSFANCVMIPRCALHHCDKTYVGETMQVNISKGRRIAFTMMIALCEP